MKNKISILVVDDESPNFDVIESIFSASDYELNYASSGHKAITLLGRLFRPDVILLDVMMPSMDGIETCRRIRTMPNCRTVPIIMVTALTAKEDLARCLNAGANDFISKPINRLELKARVNSMIKIKQQYDKISILYELQKNTVQLLEKSLNELRGNLAVSFPHELNTPLKGVLSSFAMLTNHLGDGEVGEQREIISLGMQSAQRLEQLIQRFLNYLALELETRQYQDSEVLVPSSPQASLMTRSDLIPMMATAKAESYDRGGDLQLDIQNAQLGVKSDHLRWLIDELVDNAFKFSEPQTPVQLSSQLGERFWLEISDQGRGMTQEQIAKIGAFTQFERSSHEQPGVGLGLKIAQKVVSLYGGKLTILSTYHQKTTIQLELPLAKLQSSSNDPSLKKD